MFNKLVYTNPLIWEL